MHIHGGKHVFKTYTCKIISKTTLGYLSTEYITRELQGKRVYASKQYFLYVVL